jgi:hypothetical protein
MLPTAPAWRLSAAALLLALAALPVAAADKPCKDAGKAIDGVTTWAALARAMHDYGHCDKGPTAEVFTEAILRVVISGWPKIAEAGPILDKDAAFKSWLAKRLSSPDLSPQDTAEIRDLAKASCPKGQEKVCGELLASVEMGRAISSPDLLLLQPLTPAPAPAPAKKP